MTEEIIEEVDDEPKVKHPKIEILPTKSADVKKSESWNRSIGVSKKPLNNLVKAKKINEEMEKKKPSPSESVVKSEVKSVPTASGLSLLASYSGSDSDSQ